MTGKWCRSFPFRSECTLLTVGMVFLQYYSVSIVVEEEYRDGYPFLLIDLIGRQVVPAYVRFYNPHMVKGYIIRITFDFSDFHLEDASEGDRHISSY